MWETGTDRLCRAGVEGNTVLWRGVGYTPGALEDGPGWVVTDESAIQEIDLGNCRDDRGSSFYRDGRWVWFYYT